MKPTSFGRTTSPARRTAPTGFGRAGMAGEAATSGDTAAAGSRMPAGRDNLDALADILESRLRQYFTPEHVNMTGHDELAEQVNDFVREIAAEESAEVSDADTRDLATYLLNTLIDAAGPRGDSLESQTKSRQKHTVFEAKDHIQPLLLEHIDPQAAGELDRDDLGEQVGDVVGELLVQEKINLNMSEQRELVNLLLDDMLGLGPLEPLLADESISDIMINGPDQVYVERKGKLEHTDVTFQDNRHLLNIAQRIVTAVGRRVDETSPICDARLADGSRVNVIIPPLAIDGASISIRKFAQDKITLDRMLEFGSLSRKLAQVLKIAGACRLNVLISGGTGSGKTTMLNAISQLIDKGERIVTIEDAAELQLQQPHVVRLETRPPNLEGKGEVTMRDLVKNALRMRPDRIILGEIRGAEAVDMLQAMNTGHDGSLGTIHANRPREALSRLENMVNMAGLNLPPLAVREQISNALDLIVQVSRMRDGARRTVNVTEVVGMEGDVITTQELFRYEWKGQDADGRLVGDWVSTGVRPHFMPRAEYYGLGRTLVEALN